MTLFEVAKEIADRLIATFLRGADGRRPVYGGTETFQDDPHWRDLILFYEYFHGDNGAGLGASHQTGWTGLVAPLIQLFGHLTPRGRARAGGPAAGQALPPGHRGGDRPRRDRPGGAGRPSVRLPAEPGRPRDQHVGLAARPGRRGRAAPVTLADVPADVWDAVAGPGVDAVWLMGVWQRSPAGAAIARDAPGDGRGAARRAARRHRRRRRRLGVLHPRLHRRRAPRRRRRAGRGPRRARRPRRRRCPRLRAQPRRARPPVGARAPGVLRARHGRRPRRRPGQLPRRRRRRHRPRPRPVLPGVAGGAAARRLARRTSRAAAAAIVASIAERCDGVRCDMAMLVLDDIFVRTWGERAAGGAVARRRPGLLADGDRRRAGARTRTSCSGPRRTGTSSRALVEQGFDACYDKRLYDRLVHRRAGVVDPRPPRRRSGVPGAHRALRREPRRAAAGGDAAAAGGPGRGGRRPDAARRRPAPRGPGDRAPGAGAGDARPAPGRGARRRPGGVVRPAARRRSATGMRRGTWALVDGRGLARQPLVRAPRRVDVDGAPTPGTSSSSTCPTSGPTAGSGCPTCRPGRSC